MLKKIAVFEVCEYKMKQELKKAIGGRLKKLRKNLGLTQAEMVTNFNIGRANYSRIEKGEVFPNVSILFTLKRKFNVSLDWLIGAEGEMYLTDGKGQEFRSDISQCDKEIEDLFFHFENFPMVKHAVLSFFLEYKARNSELLKKILEETPPKVEEEPPPPEII